MAFFGPRQFFDVVRQAPISRPEVFREPPRPPRRSSRRPWIFAGFAVVGLPVVVGLGVLFARAGYAYFYPGECSGNWQFAEHATQKPELDRGANADAFTAENSAVGAPGAGQEIICARFDGENLPGKILRVRVKPSWVLKTLTAPMESVSPTSSEVVELPEATSSAPGPVSSSGSEAGSAQAEPPSEAASSTAPETPALEAPAQIEAPAPTPSSPEPVVPPPPAPEPQPSAPAPAPEAPAAFWLPRAYAQTPVSDDVPKVSAALVINGYENFIAMDYSNDSETWLPIDNANLEIPVKSWDDLRSMRVRVRLLRGGEGLPTVYLDGIELETRYLADGQTEEDLAAEESAQLAAANESASAALDTITEAIADLPAVLEDAVQAVLGNEPVLTALPSSPQAFFPPRVPEPAFRFESLEQNTAARDGALYALSAKDRGAPRPNVSAATADDGRIVRFSGGCTKQYVAIVVFPREVDPIAEPTRAVVNRAEVCARGAFSLDLHEREFSDVLSEGAYVVFVAEQNELGSWYPGTLAAWNMAARKILE